MTKEDVSFLEKHYDKRELGYEPLWVKAFKYYNEKNEHKLSMACGSCYKKVLDFIKLDISLNK